MVYIDSYEQGIMVGRFHNPGMGGTYVFHSLTQFLTEMARMLDDIALPQSFTAARSFVHSAEPAAARQKGGNVESGGLATFSIRVLFRQNASWQGSVKWVEGGMEESFRSALELIFLMDSALNRSSVEQVG